jgi:hypothetical protein
VENKKRYIKFTAKSLIRG